MNKLLLIVAYLPTMVLIALIVTLLIVYFSGWRIWVIPVPPIGPPTPIFQVEIT